MQFFDKTVDVPVALQRSVPSIQKVKITVEGPLVQFNDKVVDVPQTQVQCRIPTVQTVQKTVKMPHVEAFDQVNDVPVVMQRQVPAFQNVQKHVVGAVPRQGESCPRDQVEAGVNVPENRNSGKSTGAAH